MLKKTKPNFIHGYPSSLSQLSRLKMDLGADSIRPSIISTAAELLHRKDRENITNAFGVIPYDRYAARECGNIAWECDEHNGYHINIDSVVVEFIKNNNPVNPGERGDVVITNLHSYAMPFIRYRLGDVGVPSEDICSCGLELPLMRIIEGRDEDFIALDEQKRISPMMVTCTLDHVPGLKQFRVIQEELNSLFVLLAKGKGFNSDTVNQVKWELKTILGEYMHIRCEVVEDIPRETSGKVRSVISKISS
jgi:phenylacetate-CoA ligase